MEERRNKSIPGEEIGKSKVTGHAREGCAQRKFNVASV